MRSVIVALWCAIALPGCRTGRNYLEPGGPRYAGAVPDTIAPAASRADRLRVVTFNIKFAQRIDEAISAFAADSNLRDADVVLLQEMSGVATERVARALSMGYVYYPAVYHLRNERDFGNAVLSRWPFVADAKIRLPHTARTTGTQRIATAATLRIDGTTVRVYSAHLGTIAEIGGGARRDQLEAVMADARLYPRVVIGGDMNSGAMGPVAEQHGFAWVTKGNPRTLRFARWDHLFVRGLLPIATAYTGVSEPSALASDHKAVWALLRLRSRPRVLPDTAPRRR